MTRKNAEGQDIAIGLLSWHSRLSRQETTHKQYPAFSVFIRVIRVKRTARELLSRGNESDDACVRVRPVHSETRVYLARARVVSERGLRARQAEQRLRALGTDAQDVLIGLRGLLMPAGGRQIGGEQLECEGAFRRAHERVERALQRRGGAQRFVVRGGVTARSRDE